MPSIALASSVTLAPASSSASAQQAEAEHLRRLRQPLVVARQRRRPPGRRVSRLSVSATGMRQQAADRVVGAGVDQPVDPLGAHQAARGVVHQHPVVGAGAELAAAARARRPPSRRARGRRSARPRSACPRAGRRAARTPRRRARARPAPARAAPRRRAPRACARPSARRRCSTYCLGTGAAGAAARCRHRARARSSGGRAERRSASAFGQAGPAIL